MILGMNAICALGGLQFCHLLTGSLVGVWLVCGVTREDFSASFDDETKSWTVKKNWPDGREPRMLENSARDYAIPPAIRESVFSLCG